MSSAPSVAPRSLIWVVAILGPFEVASLTALSLPGEWPVALTALGVVVALTAYYGFPAAGVTAAASSCVWFDYFFVVPARSWEPRGPENFGRLALMAVIALATVALRLQVRIPKTAAKRLASNPPARTSMSGLAASTPESEVVAHLNAIAEPLARARQAHDFLVFSGRELQEVRAVRAAAVRELLRAGVSRLAVAEALLVQAHEVAGMLQRADAVKERSDSEPARLVVVGEHRGRAASLIAYFVRHPGFILSARAVTLADAVAAANRWAPDCVLVDEQMHEGIAFETVARMRAALPTARIVVMTQDAAHAATLRLVGADAVLRIDEDRDLIARHLLGDDR